MRSPATRPAPRARSRASWRGLRAGRTFARFADGQGEPIDEGLALYFPAGASYTGEDVLELHGHGGPVVMVTLLAACLEGGERSAARAVGTLPGVVRLDDDALAGLPGGLASFFNLNTPADLAEAEARMAAERTAR